MANLTIFYSSLAFFSCAKSRFDKWKMVLLLLETKFCPVLVRVLFVGEVTIWSCFISFLGFFVSFFWFFPTYKSLYVISYFKFKVRKWIDNKNFVYWSNLSITDINVFSIIDNLIHENNLVFYNKSKVTNLITRQALEL